MKMNAAERSELPPEDFAIPPQNGRDGRYPIPDKAHAISALARVDVDGSVQEKEQVRAAVRHRYPDLPSSHGDPGSDAGQATERAAERTGKSEKAGKAGKHRGKHAKR